MVPNNHNPILEGCVCVGGEIRRLGGCQEFKVIISYAASLRPAWTTRDPLKNKTLERMVVFFNALQ